MLRFTGIPPRVIVRVATARFLASDHQCMRSAPLGVFPLSVVWLGTSSETSESCTSLARRPIGCYEAADRIPAQYRHDLRTVSELAGRMAVITNRQSQDGARLPSSVRQWL